MESVSIGLFVKAIKFASDKHRYQQRKDSPPSPYINHPIALANVLANEGGVTDLEVLCAAVLHDTIEDTKTTREELAAAFGEGIAEIVVEVTDDKTLGKKERKDRQVSHAPHLSRQAKLVKLADKISNLRDILEFPPSHWPTSDKHQYFDWAGQVIDGLRGVHPGLEAIFDNLARRRHECG